MGVPVALSGTPPRLVERLNREITELASSSELKAIFEPDAMLPGAMTPAAFSARLEQELAQ